MSGKNFRPGDMVRVYGHDQKSRLNKTDVLAPIPCTGMVLTPRTSATYSAVSLIIPEKAPHFRVVFVDDHKADIRKISAPALQRELTKLVWVSKMAHSRGYCVNMTGADPELFIMQNKKVVPAFSFLPDRAAAAKQDTLGMLRQGQFAYNDGFQAEFTIRPNACHESVTVRVREMLAELNSRKPTGSVLSFQDVVDLDTEAMNSATAEQLALGCEPSLNAWRTEPNPIPNGRELPFRTAGCHFHFSLRRTTYPQIPLTSLLRARKRMVQAMDLVAGIPSVALLQGLEDGRRRRVYGQAGEYRETAYGSGARGVEYRVLGSAAMAHPTIFNILLDLARAGIFNYKTIVSNLAYSPAQVQDIINNYDSKGAWEFIRANAAFFGHFIRARYGASPAKTLVLFRDGATQYFDIGINSWRLSSPLSANWRPFGYDVLPPVFGGINDYLEA